MARALDARRGRERRSACRGAVRVAVRGCRAGEVALSPRRPPVRRLPERRQMAGLLGSAQPRWPSVLGGPPDRRRYVVGWLRNPAEGSSIMASQPNENPLAKFDGGVLKAIGNTQLDAG